jgi:hypothetical protein
LEVLMQDEAYKNQAKRKEAKQVAEKKRKVP